MSKIIKVTLQVTSSLVLLCLCAYFFSENVTYYYYSKAVSYAFPDNTMITETTASDEPLPPIRRKYYDGDFRLGIENVEQLPELPTGCEIASLAAVLRYWNNSVDKTVLARDFLPKANTGNPDEVFVGDPFSDVTGLGCNAPVIVSVANRYLSAHSSVLRAKNLTASSFAQIVEYLRNGHPVIIWGFLDSTTSTETVQWEYEGQTYSWFLKSHTMVLIGMEGDNYIFADPLKDGIVKYNKTAVEEAYLLRGKQAVVIMEDE